MEMPSSSVLSPPLNYVLRSQILPALSRCVECGKSEAAHTAKDHDYARDVSRPEWKDWHAFRRGLATNLYDLGMDDHTIKAILHHSSVTVTRRSYIKPSAQTRGVSNEGFDTWTARVGTEP